MRRNPEENQCNLLFAMALTIVVSQESNLPAFWFDVWKSTIVLIKLV